MNQTNQILDYLRTGKAITPLEALNHFGCFRLGARIYEIKKLGYKVKTEIERQGDKHWAKYSLLKETLF